NALVKQERSVVSSIAGTTIDPVNESVVHKDKVIEFVDTAGIRKRGKIQGLERFALNRTEKILSHSQIALLVLDAHEGFNELDERIAGLVAKHYLGVIIVLNKWDKSEMDFDKTVKELRLDRFKFLAYAPVISVSALSGKRVHVLLDKILQIFENFTQKIQTSKLNTLIENATRVHPLPHDYGKLVKIYYAVQYDLAPPKIALIMNRPKALHFSYKRYLQNQIRKEFDFEGVPLVIASRKKGSKENDES
ncbi:TPA: GTP-binding protein, partial [Campylobacter jejuni]|nr:GTP-binding protein [Campylobacter jejuni]